MKLALSLGLLLLAGSTAPFRTDTRRMDAGYIGTERTDNGWKTVVSKYGHFSARMPAPVQEQVASSSEEGGTVWQYLYNFNNGAPNGLGVSCWDYSNAPKRRLDSGELDGCAEVQRQSLLPGKFSVKKIRLGSVPGRELRIVHPDGKADLFRLYLRGRRLYSISAETDGSAHATADARAFLNSFRLLP